MKILFCLLIVMLISSCGPTGEDTSEEVLDVEIGWGR